MDIKEAKRLSLIKWNAILEWIKKQNELNIPYVACDVIMMMRTLYRETPELSPLDHGCGFCEYALSGLTADCFENESQVFKINKCYHCPLAKLENCGKTNGAYMTFVNSPTIETTQLMIDLINNVKTEE